MSRASWLGALMMCGVLGCGEQREQAPVDSVTLAAETHTPRRPAGPTSSAPTSGAPTSAPSDAPTAAPVAEADVKALGLSPDGERALRTLLTSPHFGGWAVGAAGSPTPPVVALRTLSKEKEAARALSFVLGHGTLAGQLMALAGLFDADPPTFKRELARYRAMTGEVRLMTSGCDPGGDLVSVAEVLDKKGAAQLTGPDDDLGKWSQRNPKVPLELDLAGGGYTVVMRPR